MFAASDPLPALPLKDKTPPSADAPPPAPREFRAAWVATVANIDWPSAPGLSGDEQKKEIMQILDRSVELNLNVIVLQVRTSCDALYESKLEPWSEFLTGTQGKSPGYDPLKMWIDEAHARGIELHAWFNPFRARYAGAKGENAAMHISKTHPDWVKNYGRMLWLDPGEPGAQDMTYEVFMDVVKRYDVDGIHIDDYFYPYPEAVDPKDATAGEAPFPDDQSWKKYEKSGGKLSRNDWRRENISKLIKRIYEGTKKEKSWVKFGISPFGIPRPQLDGIEYVKGFDQYDKLYADAAQFLREGWCDYYAPQLYWRTGAMNQSYLGLLQWWTHHNPKGRGIYPGLFTTRIDWSEGSWDPWEIIGQMQTTRLVPGAGGNVQFSMIGLAQNRAGIADLLRANHYAESALVPASPWLDNDAPLAPTEVKSSYTAGASTKPPESKAPPAKRPGPEKGATTLPYYPLTARPAPDPTLGSTHVTWRAAGKGEKVWQWAIYSKHGASWHFKVVPAAQMEADIRDEAADGAATMVGVASVDRNGNESKRLIVKTSEWKPLKAPEKK